MVVESIALHGIIFGSSIAGMLFVLANFQVPSGGDRILFRVVMWRLLRPFIFSAFFSIAMVVAGLALPDLGPASVVVSGFFLLMGVVFIVVYLYGAFYVIYKIFPHRHLIAPQAHGTPIERMNSFVDALEIKVTIMKQVLAKIYDVYSNCEVEAQKKQVASFFVETLFSAI